MRLDQPPGYPANLAGATAATRYVGGTASVAPTTGTFQVGDYVITQTGGVYVCTVAGTPGTWVDAATIGPAVASVFGRTGAVVAATNDYTYAQIAASAAAIAIANLADPTTGKVIGSAANAAAAVFPPGYEINYTQITSSVNVASTTEASGTTIISPGAITFDGTAVYCEVFAPTVTTAANLGSLLVVSLFEGATQIARLAAFQPEAAVSLQAPMFARYRFTPSAAAHTYTITAFSQSVTGTPQINAGATGTGAYAPAYCRFVKA